MNRLLSNGYKPLYCDGVVEVGRFSANSIHATHYLKFSVKIIILPLLQTTNEGDLVLDPFCGSYTTGRVSQRNNRRFVGYDVKVY